MCMTILLYCNTYHFGWLVSYSSSTNPSVCVMMGPEYIWKNSSSNTEFACCVKNESACAWWTRQRKNWWNEKSSMHVITPTNVLCKEWNSHYLSENLQPYRERPQTSKLLADRLVTGALGMRSKMTKEERVKEREKLKEAKSKFGFQHADWGKCLYHWPMVWQLILLTRNRYHNSQFSLLNSPSLYCTATVYLLSFLTKYMQIIHHTLMLQINYCFKKC